MSASYFFSSFELCYKYPLSLSYSACPVFHFLSVFFFLHSSPRDLITALHPVTGDDSPRVCLLLGYRPKRAHAHTPSMPSNFPFNLHFSEEKLSQGKTPRSRFRPCVVLCLSLFVATKNISGIRSCQSKPRLRMCTCRNKGE